MLEPFTAFFVTFYSLASHAPGPANRVKDQNKEAKCSDNYLQYYTNAVHVNYSAHGCEGYYRWRRFEVHD